MFLTTRPIWNPIRPPGNAREWPTGKQFLKGISESTTNWHKSIKAAKVVIASRVNQSLLNTFSETIIVDLEKNNNKNNNIVSCNTIS